MPIPDFQSLMRPLLEFISDGRVVSAQEALLHLTERFRLSESEQKQLLPSGRQAVFANRVAWAKTHLKMAGLVEGTARGVFRITSRGQELLREREGKIGLRLLQTQPGYLEARHGKKDSFPGESSISKEVDQTPEEEIDTAYQELRESLGKDLLDRLKAASPAFFERLVVDLLVRMGYGGTRKDAGQAIGRSGDEGIDGVIKEDRLGLDTIYIQAKKWEGTVGRPEIQKFAGALQGFRARKGIFITTSNFSKEALDYASRIESKIVLIDGEQLWNLMVDFRLGTSTIATYEIQRVDSDFFSENE